MIERLVWRLVEKRNRGKIRVEQVDEGDGQRRRVYKRICGVDNDIIRQGVLTRITELTRAG